VPPVPSEATLISVIFSILVRPSRVPLSGQQSNVVRMRGTVLLRPDTHFVTPRSGPLSVALATTYEAILAAVAGNGTIAGRELMASA
jgi:hypothetical protein